MQRDATLSGSKPLAWSRGASFDRSADALADAFASVGVTMRFARNAEIYGEGERREYLYQVVSGAVRTSKVLECGRRLIDAFHRPGDIFGIEAGDDHDFTADALSDCHVRVVKYATLMAMSARDADLAAELRRIVTGKLKATQDHMVLLGRKTAEEKVASFLLAMVKVSVGEAFELPMSRQDIADFLGLTIETVSRTLTQFRKRATIDLSTARHVTLRDRRALQRLNA